jgi:hypothetical protein
LRAFSNISPMCSASTSGTVVQMHRETYHSHKQYAPFGCSARCCLSHSLRPWARPATPSWGQLRLNPSCRTHARGPNTWCRERATKSPSRAGELVPRTVRHGRAARSGWRRCSRVGWTCMKPMMVLDSPARASPGAKLYAQISERSMRAVPRLAGALPQ